MTMWKRAALALAALCLVASSANAEIVYKMLKADTLHLNAADSSAVVNVENFKSMWLNFSVMTAPSDTVRVIPAADTTVLLLVQAREHVPAATIGGVGWLTAPAAYSDSTVISWSGRYRLPATTAVGDTVSINAVANTASGASSSEYLVMIHAANAIWCDRQTARLDLVGTTCVPFRAKFASFRWRLVGSGPAVARLRVVLAGVKE